jgi:hypothetical protein
MKWWEDRSNLALLVRYMANTGYAGREIADMVSEPWHWDGEFDEAKAWAEKTEQGFAALCR